MKKSVGFYLKTIRNYHNMTQKEVAKALNITPILLCKYETNRCEPNIKMLKAMASLYHVSIDHLVGYTFEKIAKDNTLEEEKEIDYKKLYALMEKLKI